MSRDTSTGRVFESSVIPALDHAGYNYSKQVSVGNKPNGTEHKVDLVIYNANEKVLVSKKWQQSNGTAEEKIPFEVIMLANACKEFGYKKAYLVLGGTDKNTSTQTEGWTLRQWYLSGDLKQWIDDKGLVHIIKFEDFLARINRKLII